MKESCNLDLELGLSSSDECSSCSPHHQSSQDLQQQQQQQLTNFYNGMMRVGDVTELQARAILCVANNEIGKIVVKTSTTPSWSPSELSSARNPYYPLRSSPAGGLSMQKSLQKFLQMRKNRSQATHPYRTTPYLQISLSQS